MIYELRMPPGRRIGDAAVGKIIWVSADSHYVVNQCTEGMGLQLCGRIDGENFIGRIDYTLPQDRVRLRSAIYS